MKININVNRTIIISLLLVFFITPACTLGITRSGGSGDNQEPPANDVPLPPVFPVNQTVDGWTDMSALLVPCNSRSVGTADLWNGSRDPGSKLLYFDLENGDNSTGELYWWDGTNIVDSEGNTANGNGEAYGTNPLDPNLDAIYPFAFPAGIRGNSDVYDLRLRSHSYDFNAVSAGYPDWFLFRRGVEHTLFDGFLFGGQSIDHPMVVGAYGPAEEGRAVMNPEVTSIAVGSETRQSVGSPFNSTLQGDNAGLVHMFYYGLEFRSENLNDGEGYFGIVGLADLDDPSNGEPTSMYIEDCKFVNVTIGGEAKRIDVFRSVSAFRWSAAHNQGFFPDGYEAQGRFEEVVFYKNGYKQDPLRYADPGRDIFSRNIYQGGGARMGFTYTNIISADGASGGPQMRLGGLIENSLIIEGYWFSSTNSNNLHNPWLEAEGQSSQSALVRNNVQLILSYPTPYDPDSNTGGDESSVQAQPGDGYQMFGATFGAEVYGNIISAAMLTEDLGSPNVSRAGIQFDTAPDVYENGRVYSLYNNRIYDNIIYNTTAGISANAPRVNDTGVHTGGDWSDAEGVIVENNVFAALQSVQIDGINITSTDQLDVRNNRFYTKDAGLQASPYTGTGNTHEDFADAAASEGWTDPDRTLLRYVTEYLHLTLLDWSDDPNLPASQIDSRRNNGELYDPTGLKTFMAVATNMRHGGISGVPASGKPSWLGDYEWDPRFTGAAVVNWIRAGFGLEEVPDPADG